MLIGISVSIAVRKLNRALPVVTGYILNSVLAVGNVKVSVIEEVGYGVAGIHRLRILGAVCLHLEGIYEIGVTVRIHNAVVRRGVALRSQDIVYCIVAILRYGEEIFARIYKPGLVSVSIVGCKILAVYLYGNHLARALCKLLCLCKAD